MMAYPWQYDETVQVGTDYQDESEVRAYDLRMSRLRDMGKEIAGIVQALELGTDSTVWEIGTCAARIGIRLVSRNHTHIIFI